MKKVEKIYRIRKNGSPAKYLNAHGEFVEDVRKAHKYANRTTANIVLDDYKDEVLREIDREFEIVEYDEMVIYPDVVGNLKTSIK